MSAPIRQRIAALLGRPSYEQQRMADAVQVSETHPDLEPEFAQALSVCLPHSMASVERMYALWQAVGHVARHQVSGDVVECGVWKGGSSMMAALALMHYEGASRRLWLYDTYEGMSEPDERDVDAVSGAAMVAEWDTHRGQPHDPVFAFGALDEVRQNMGTTGYPGNLVDYVQGEVETTIPATAPAEIALLRLDTDWYASTKHELEHLWGRLRPNGVLIIDDYGHWAGAREAVDEFFDDRPDAPLLSRIDYTGRIGIKR